MDWSELIVRVGLPTASLVAIGWFVAARVWPFVVSAWETQQEERREERRRFLDALGEERKSFQAIVLSERTGRVEEREKFLTALEGHRQQLEAITRTQQEIRQAISDDKRDK